MELKAGQIYRNRLGAFCKILDVDNRYATYRFGKTSECSVMESDAYCNPLESTFNFLNNCGYKLFC